MYVYEWIVYIIDVNIWVTKHLNANVDADADAGLEYPGREILLLLEQLRQLGNKLIKERR